MPLPKPRNDETHNEYVSRCISFVKNEKPDTPDKQAQAMCFQLWRDWNKESVMDTINGNIIESQSLKEAFGDSTFDKDKRIIQNVVLLGPTSKNNRIYTENCMRNAVPMYEGVQAFVNHPSKEEETTGRRDVRNLAGKFVNVKFDEATKKIRGDFKGLPNSPNSLMYMDIAETMPDIAGNSQNAMGKWRIADQGKKIVEEITKVISVDLVANPATTNGMFESEDNNKGDQAMNWNEITLSSLRENRPDLITKVIQEGKDLRNDEVKKLTEEKEELKTKVDEFEVKEAAVKKRQQIDKLVEESKLPKEAVTDTFIESLERADDEEEIKKMIDDRKKLIQEAKGGPRNMGGDRKAGDDEGKIKEEKESHSNFVNR